MERWSLLTVITQMNRDRLEEIVQRINELDKAIDKKTKENEDTLVEARAQDALARIQKALKSI